MMDNANFKSEKISNTATVTLNGHIDQVFGLFGAFEERKWAKDWNPILIYPSAELIEEGTTFKTPGHGHDEKEFVWRVTRYEKEEGLIQYLVSSENRYWTITIKCRPTMDNKTKAEIGYTFIGLNELGNELDHHFLQRLYRDSLRDWEDAINYYLVNGSIKNSE